VVQVSSGQRSKISSLLRSFSQGETTFTAQERIVEYANDGKMFQTYFLPLKHQSLGDVILTHRQDADSSTPDTLPLTIEVAVDIPKRKLGADWRDHLSDKADITLDGSGSIASTKTGRWVNASAYDFGDHMLQRTEYSLLGP
jgi:hypothetical protein